MLCLLSFRHPVYLLLLCLLQAQRKAADGAARALTAAAAAADATAGAQAALAAALAKEEEARVALESTVARLLAAERLRNTAAATLHKSAGRCAAEEAKVVGCYAEAAKGADLARDLACGGLVDAYAACARSAAAAL